MMCPWAARIGARRSPQPTSDILIDPLQPSDRLDRLSRAAPALVAAPRPGARGCRLRSEGTETALLPVGVFYFFFHRAEVPVPDCPSFIIDAVPSFSTSSLSPAPHCRSPPFCHLAYPPLLAPGARDSRSRSSAGGGKRGSRGAGHGEGGDGEVCTARHEGRGKVQEWSSAQGKGHVLFTPYRKKANHSWLF